MIGADWHPPRFAQQTKAWDALDAETRERFTRLQREGWRDVPRIDQLADEPAESAWVEYELVPPDPRQGDPVRIARWPVKLEIDEENRVRAIVAEYGDVE
jgi:hypothetical protein